MLISTCSRIKLSADPNNTEWQRDTSRFGHKILSAQGWKQGDHLGAKNAAHASHYTEANLSHIRIALKDDTLGLGAPKPRERAENFGLGIFGDVLSRLNGASEEKLEESANKRRDIGLKLYQTERWGTMQFVSAGFLVGDEIVKKEDPRSRAESMKVSQEASKKRKRADESEAVTAQSADVKDSSKKQKTKEKRKSKKSDSSESSEESQDDSISKKAKKHKKEKSIDAEKSAPEAEDSSEDAGASDSKSDKRRRKEEKRRLKEEKKRLKEEKRARKAAKKLLGSTAEDSTSATSTPSSALATSTSSPFPPSSGTSTPRALSGRHLARSRYIQAKKLASQDPKALREILMVKSPA